MTKFNLTDETVKVGDLKLDKSQFDIPKKVTILSSRVAPVYKNINGEALRQMKWLKLLVLYKIQTKSKP